MELDHLWRGRIKSILGQIAAEETDFEENANLAEQIGADYHGRFLIELLQNAEDQTDEVTPSRGLAIIVRTASTIAVLNEGQPFNDKGIRSITAAGISPKKASESIGNKGVGFKAVYQISDRPEVYSAPQSGDGLFAPDRTAFRMEQAPFEDLTFRERMEGMVQELLKDDPRLRRELEAQLGRENLQRSILDRLEQAAPFKFPKPLDEDDFAGRMSLLGKLPDRLVDRMTTLVVLPLLTNEHTTTVVKRAVDELVASDTPGAALLFLRRISKLRVYDWVRGQSWLLTRDQLDKSERLERGATLVRSRTSCVRLTDGSRTRTSKLWWLVRRRMGEEGDDPTARNEEADRIATAVERLPGRSWRVVRSAYAAIALPRVRGGESSPKPFREIGRLAIGLPTLKETGTPVWCDGPFHGNVARTEIDLAEESQPYNHLIFEECEKLHWQAVKYVKEYGAIGDKRALPFWFAVPHPDAPLARCLRRDERLASEELILSRSGRTFVAAQTLTLPEPGDGDIFASHFMDISELDRFGFHLPDPELFRIGRDILDQLAGGQCPTVPDSAYYARPADGQSLLETIASHHSDTGPQWWEPFLAWLAERFELTDISDQAVLPVVSGSLARPADGVFLIPHGQSTSDDSDEDDEDAVEDLEPDVASTLPFLDPDRVRARRRDRPRQLTEIGRTLSPDASDGLVRRPRRVELINEVIAPRLADWTAHEPQAPRCAVLLRNVGKWLSEISPRDLQRVHLAQLRVPTGESGGQWKWRSPVTVYFGAGWLDDQEQEHCLRTAYSHRAGSMLVPWEEFSTWIQSLTEREGFSPDRDAWRSYLDVMGVNCLPRLLVIRPRQAYFRSHSYHALSIDGNPESPFPQTAAEWRPYLEYLSRRPAQTTSDQAFFARPLSWIDGLEEPEARAAVMKLVFTHPHQYEGNLETVVERRQRTDSQRLLAFWAWAIREFGWPVVPSNLGPTPPDVVWELRGDDRRRRFVEAENIPVLPDECARSYDLKAAFGVYSPETVPVERLVIEIHRVAEQLANGERSVGRYTSTYVQKLYEWLQERCVEYEDGLEYDLEPLLTAPVPMIRSEEVVAVDLTDKSGVIYLNDDPQRAEHVAGWATGYSLPLSARGGFEALLHALRNLLGTERVRRVSEDPLKLAFQRDPSRSSGRLLELIRDFCGDAVDQTVLGLAAVIAYGRPEQPMEPTKGTFKERWADIRECRVLFGDFPGDDSAPALFDALSPDGPVLYVAADRGNSASDLIRLCWPILGRGYRDVLEAFAGSVSAGTEAAFLRERGIGRSERDELETIIGGSSRHALERLKPVAFALWRRGGQDSSLASFGPLWDATSASPPAVSTILGTDESTAQTLLREAREILNGEGELTLAELAGISVSEWQEARTQLGLERVRFRDSERAFSRAARWVASALTVALPKYRRFELADAQVALDQIVSGMDACPNQLAEDRIGETEALAVALRMAADLLEGTNLGQAAVRLVRALRREAQRAPESASELQIPGVTQREVLHISDFPASERERAAREAIDGVLRVGRVLAAGFGEDLDSEALQGDTYVARLASGRFANVYAALRNLGRAIAADSPRTAVALRDKQAFRQPRTLPELWQAFPELEAAERDNEATSPPPRRYRLFDMEETRETLEQDLSKGSEGEIGRQLKTFVDTDLDLASMALIDRDPIDPEEGDRQRSGGGGGGGGRPSRQDEDEQVGLLGEAFLYEYLRLGDFPGFDRWCWVSENRARYGGDGDDAPVASGYDFRYRDVEGRLTGRDDAPLCLIEVKSTVGDGQVPFPMSANEWRVAEECHDPGDERVYVIVRVRSVRDKPEIFDVIVDPVKALREGWLQLRNKDLYLRVGPKRPQDAVEDYLES